MSAVGNTNETISEKRRRAGPTIQDVAHRANVSTATVSRCLNEPDLVIPATRERVLKAVDELGYAPNFSAKTLAANKSGTIGAIIPTMENAIFARGLQAFQEELGEFGFTLLVASSAYRQDLEAEQIRNLVARGVDALMLIGHDRDPGIYEFLAKRGLPFVNAWTYDRGIDAASVGFDNRAAMRGLAEKVLALGHTRIGVISALRTHNDRARERMEGIRDAISAAGLQSDSLTTLDVTYSISNGAESFKKLMEVDDRPTAIMCGNDVLAVGALNMARQMGVDVPKDVSITGFDDIELAQVSSPALTTVHVPHRQMGKRAAGVLIDMLRDGAPREAVRLETAIMLRDTLAKPKL
ncbi:MAG: LacI family DNA-binding transcriptional regulator [Devosiaceae bacterium]